MFPAGHLPLFYRRLARSLARSQSRVSGLRPDTQCFLTCHRFLPSAPFHSGCSCSSFSPTTSHGSLNVGRPIRGIRCEKWWQNYKKQVWCSSDWQVSARVEYGTWRNRDIVSRNFNKRFSLDNFLIVIII